MKASAEKSSSTVSRTTASRPFFAKAGGGDFFAPVNRAAVPAVQAKMTVGKTGDKFEREADRMADKVMRMPSPASSAKEEKIQRKTDERLQKAAKSEEKIQKKEKQEEKIQKAPAGDKMMDKVMRMPSPASSAKEEKIQRKPDEKLQKKENEKLQKAPAEEKLQKKEDDKIRKAPAREEKLQRKSNDAAPAVSSTMQSAIRSKASGGGQPLSADVRRDMEGRFNADFSQVRVHSDAEAGTLSNQLSARAFTHRNHIFFSRNQYQPGTSEGKQLLAHELTHTIQQGHAVQRSQQVSTTVTQIHSQQHDVLHRDIWDDIGGIGGHLVSGAEYVGEIAGDAYETARDYLAGMIENYAPGLLVLLRSDLVGTIKEKITEGLNSFSGGLLSSIRERGLGETLFGILGEIVGGISQAAGDLSVGGCSAILSAARALIDFGQTLIGPVVEQLHSVLSAAAAFFSDLWGRFGMPAVDAIRNLAGDAWAWIESKAQWIWAQTAPVREAFAQAWQWLKEQFNLAWGTAGDILDWFREKAVAAWEEVKKTIEPIMGPLKVIGTVLLLISPLGPIVLVGTGAWALWNGLQWLRDNWDDLEIVVQARQLLHDQIIPAVMSGIEWLRSALSNVAIWIGEQITQLSAAFLSLLEALGLSPIFAALHSAVESISEQFERVAEWVRTDFVSFLQEVRQVLLQVWDFLRPILVLFAAVILFPVYPWMLPMVLAGWAWQVIPNCLKGSIVDFAIEVMITALESMPDFTNFGDAWAKAKEQIIGILRDALEMDTEQKIEMADRIAQVMTGQDIAWIGNLITAARYMPGQFEGQVQEELIGMNLTQPLPFERTTPPNARALVDAGTFSAVDTDVLRRATLTADDISVDQVVPLQLEPELLAMLNLAEGEEREFGESTDPSRSVKAIRSEMTGSAEVTGTEPTAHHATGEQPAVEAQLQALMDQPGPQGCTNEVPGKAAGQGEVPEAMRIGPLTQGQRARYLMNQMWKGIRKWFSCNWQWLVPSLIAAIVVLVALEIVTGGAVTAALPPLMEIIGTIMVGVAIVRAGYYLAEYVAKGVTGDVAGAAQSLARGLAVGAIELVFALLFNIGAVIKSLKLGLGSSMKVAARTVSETAKRTTQAVGRLGQVIAEGGRTAAGNIQRVAGAVLRNGRLVMDNVGSSIGRGIRSLDDLARRLWRRVRFRRFKIRRVTGRRFQLWGFINPWALLADGRVEFVEETDVAGHRVGEFAEVRGERGFIAGWQGDAINDASQLVQQLRNVAPDDAAAIYRLIDHAPDPRRFLSEVLRIHNVDEIVTTLRNFDEIADIPGAQKLMRDLTTVGRQGRTSRGAIGEIQYAAQLRREGVPIRRIGDFDEVGREAADIILDSGRVVDVKNYNWSMSWYRNADGSWRESAIDWMIRDRIAQIRRYRRLYAAVGQRGADVPIQFAFMGPLSDVPPRLVSRLRLFENVEVVGIP